MTAELWIDTITSVGFPIALCLWFMLRTEKVINNNTAAFIKFTEMNSK